MIAISHCRLESHKLICNSNLFNAKDKDDIIKTEYASPTACEMAVKYKNSIVGKIVPLGKGLLGTRNKLKYKCSWAQDVATVVKEFYVEQYDAYVNAESDVIMQSITKTQCKYEVGKMGFCIPQEQPSSSIVFGPIPALQPLYRLKGVLDIYETHDVFTIPELSTGGAALRRTPDYILLDTSYLIALSNKKLKDMEEINDTLKLETKMATSLTLDHFSGQMGRIMNLVEARLKSLERVLCSQMKSVEMIEEGISSLYQTAQLISDKAGYIKVRRGERFIYSRCMVVHQYQPRWDRTIIQEGKKKCTNEIPINFEDKMKFLYLPTRQLHEIPSYRECNDGGFYFVEGKNGTLFKINQEGSIQLRKEHLEVFKYTENIPELEDIDLNNLHRNETQMALPMLLKVMTQKSNKLQAFLNDETTVSAVPIKHAAEDAARHIKGWIQTEIWEPAKKYIYIGSAILFVAIMALIFHRCIIPAFRKRRRGRKDVATVLEMNHLNLGGHTPAESRRLVASASLDGIALPKARRMSSYSVHNLRDIYDNQLFAELKRRNQPQDG